MYYYEKYNVLVLISTLILLIIFLFFLFRNKISTLIDPLSFHLLWCASVLSLLVGYVYKYQLNLSAILFALTFVIYISVLYFSLRVEDRVKLRHEEVHFKLVTMYFACLVLFMISRYEFILYALKTNSPLEWVFYRFKQVEGRNPIQYILQLGARPFFLYYTFVIISTGHKLKRLAYAMLVINLFMDIIAGGRSSLIGVIMMFGYFIYLFPNIFSVKRLRKINIFGLLGIFIALTILAIVTSLYNPDYTVKDGYLAMLNRLLAAGDGLDMYLVNNADQYIPSGLWVYIKSVFGIFLKRVSSINPQSIGWQLYELDQGKIVPFSVGPNFILPLQAVIIGPFWLIPYCILIGFIVSVLRNNYFGRFFKIPPVLSFALGTLSFEPVLDMELFILYISGVLALYFLFVYPFLRIRVIWGIPKLVFKFNR